MATKRDYYEVLGVPRDADAEAIKKAFRTLAVKYHPDRSTEPDAEERFKEIAEAYAVLSKPDKRAAYDAGGHDGVGGMAPEDMFRDIDFGEIFGGFGFDFGDGIFDRMFGRRARPRRGGNLEVALSVPLETIAKGGKETVRLAHPTPCSVCKGSGAEAGSSPRRCDDCGGTGQRITREQKQGISIQRSSTCPTCHGRGETIDRPCRACGGSGQGTGQETIAVHIPAGIEDGTPLRVAGHGLPGGAPGTPPGDLYVVVRAAPDTRFERRGADLWRSETVDVADAALGTKVTVPTLNGNVSVTIPPGTQPDATLRIAGKGLPRFGTGGKGDMYLRIKVRVPRSLTREQRELYERLRSHSQAGEAAR